MEPHRPGMKIIRTVMPDATLEEQEAALERLRSLVKTMVRAARERIEREQDSRDLESQGRIRSITDPP